MNTTAWLAFGLLLFAVGRRYWLHRGVISIPAMEVERRLAAGEKLVVADVRESAEFRSGHIPGALLLPLSALESGAARLNAAEEIVLVCASGNRSLSAYRRLKARGFTNLKNMRGGMSAWRGAVVRG